MRRFVFVLLVSVALLWCGVSTAAASTEYGWTSTRFTVQPWVRTPVAVYSFNAHWVPATVGAAVPAGIAWAVTARRGSATPEPPWEWTYSNPLFVTAPADYWIEQGDTSLALNGQEGADDITLHLKAYDANSGNIDEMSVHYYVTLDQTRPVTYAPRPAACRRGATVALRFRITDNLSRKEKTTIMITRCGAVVKVLSCGWRLTWGGAPSPNQRKTFRCTLPKGRYRFTVKATDQAGNAAVRLGSNTLTVR